MLNARSSRILLFALVCWVAFGGWALFGPNVDSRSVDPLVGHVVVFFFVAFAGFGLLWRHLGAIRTLLGGGLVITVAAAASEALQPILTQTRQAQPVDLLANLVGIAGAAAVSGLVAAVLHRSAGRELFVGVCCFLGLGASAFVVVVGPDPIREAIECRGSGYEPISDLVGGPIIAIEGDSARVGTASGIASPTMLDNGIVGTDSADLRCSVMASGAYTIVATVVPDSDSSGGPARIFTSSIGTEFDQYNTHLGQDFDELSIRVRSGSGQQWESVPGVFADGERVTVAMVVSLQRGEVIAFVDGEERARFELVGDFFTDWDDGFVVMVGDEFTRNRTFEGDVESVYVYDRAVDAGDQLLAG